MKQENWDRYHNHMDLKESDVSRLKYCSAEVYVKANNPQTNGGLDMCVQHSLRVRSLSACPRVWMLSTSVYCTESLAEWTAGIVLSKYEDELLFFFPRMFPYWWLFLIQGIDFLCNILFFSCALKAHKCLCKHVTHNSTHKNCHAMTNSEGCLWQVTNSQISHVKTVHYQLHYLFPPPPPP